MNRLLVIAFLFAALPSQAQDAVASQLHRMPAWLNPAYTGDLSTDYRAQTAYRREWPGLAAPYITSFAQAEMQPWQSQWEKHYLGVGLTVVHDQLGNRALNHFEVHGATAVNLASSDYNQWAFGLQLGYVRRTLNTDDLRWDNQYNGVAYDPSLPTGENFIGATRGHVDAGFGMRWTHTRKINFQFGYALHHFLQDRTVLNWGEDRYGFRHTVTWNSHARYEFFEADYHVMFIRQSGAQLLQGGMLASIGYGTNSRYTTARSSSAVLAGLTYRWGDALTPSIGMRWKRVGEIVLAYDLTLSAWRQAVDYRGGWEVHLRYDGFFTDQRRRLK